MSVTRQGVSTDMTTRMMMRHFRESMKSLGRNTWMTFASVSAVTITLLLVGVFLVILMNLNHFAKSVENDVEIRVHIDVSAKEADQNELKQKIQGIPEVDNVVFSSKEQELEDLIKSMGKEGEAFELFEQNNPLNDVFVVKTKDPKDTIKVAKEIETFNNAYKVKYGESNVKKLFKVTSVSRNIGLGLIIGLVFTAMFLISNTIKITITARRREIEIMKLVGATNWFIRWPFFLEGLMLGLLGSIIPIALVLGAYDYILRMSQPKLTDTFIELLPYSPFAFQIAGVLVALGAIIGVWGSLMSVRKFLKV